MDAIRYILAISVIVGHFNELLSFKLPVFITGFNAVGGFFVISGFLIFRSYEKSKSLKSYVQKRIRRILPTYYFIIIICAIGLSVISNLCFNDYFTSLQWWKYLISNLCFLNFIEPCLPGVFENNYIQAVNGSLWTIKVEWSLYLSIPVVFYIIKRFKLNSYKIIILLYIVSVLYRVVFLYLYSKTQIEIYNILSRQFFGQLCYFYTGVFMYFQLKNFLKYKWYIFVSAILLLLFKDYIWMYDITLGPLVVSVLVLFFAFTGKWGYLLKGKNNISYDMYLWHFPLIQICSYFGIQHIGQYYAFIIVFGITIFFSCFTWFVVGKRYLYPKIR